MPEQTQTQIGNALHPALLSPVRGKWLAWCPKCGWERVVDRFDDAMAARVQHLSSKR